MFGLSGGMTLILIFCVLTAVFFEFINGFHDTANAVATVIYTNSMKPTMAVIFSGIGNFLGVFIGIAVAMEIVSLLPLALLVDQSVAHSVAMILSLMLTAILWNFGTWYFGIPCSSSHTLFGSIFGVGIAYGLLSSTGTIALNMQKVKDVVLALLLSPVIGFGLTMATVIFIKKRIKMKKLFAEPVKKKAPPFWIRFSLIVTSGLVSFSHGSNDGQKGIGLLMIIFISLAPVHFALNHARSPQSLLVQVNNVNQILSGIGDNELNSQGRASKYVIVDKLAELKTILTDKTDFKDLKKSDHFEIRKDILILSSEIKTMLSANTADLTMSQISGVQRSALKEAVGNINSFTEYAPWWVILIVSISIGLGTMIGWKRIVVTVGERIGKEHLNYAQGVSANLITAFTIGLATFFGLPVSTTHVLSSGVGGSMVATHGIKNLRMKTVKNILVAWLVTIPVTMVVAGALFLLLRAVL